MSIHANEIETAQDQSARVGRSKLELLVLPAMLLVSIAIGAAGHLHLGLTTELAASVTLCLFCILLVSHVLLRATDRTQPSRSRQRVRSRDRAEQPREASNVRPADKAADRTKPLPEGQHPRRDAPAAPAGPKLEKKDLIAAAQSLSSASVVPQTGSETKNRPSPDPASRISPGGAAAGGPKSTNPQQYSLPPVLSDPEGRQAALAAAGWALHAEDPALAPTMRGTPQAEPKPGSLGMLRPGQQEEQLPPASADEQRTRESERVNGILRRLASQIRGERVTPQAAAKPSQVPISKADGPSASRHAPPSSGLPDARTDITLDSAVEALRSTVASMRATGAAAPEAPPSQLEMRLAEVADALARERVEICLEPILALADDRASHFEVTVRLQSPAGQLVDAREALEAAGRAQASGAGLLPVLDALGLRHSAGIALKLERRGRQGSVFSQVGGESLRDPRFVSDVAGRHSQGIADRMVLTFAQNEVQGLGSAQHSVLGSLSQLGFRFALCDVSHLEMDFEALRSIGFEFIKLDAEVFLKGLTLGSATIPPTDLCRYFADQGLTIIVGQIEDEWVRARILGFGVVFGQGTLFGGPRPVQVTASQGQGSQVVA